MHCGLPALSKVLAWVYNIESWGCFDREEIVGWVGELAPEVTYHVLMESLSLKKKRWTSHRLVSECHTKLLRASNGEWRGRGGTRDLHFPKLQIMNHGFEKKEWFGFQTRDFWTRRWWNQKDVKFIWLLHNLLFAWDIYGNRLRQNRTSAEM